MTNFSAKILNNSVGALSAQQAVIANTANNIANVNTPGYTRRVVDLQTRVARGNAGGINIGNGVEVGRILRITDAFLERSLRAATADRGSANVQNDMLGRLQELFSLTGERQTIGSTFTSFFTAINDLAANPSNIELRSNVIARANELTGAIQTTYNSIASLQTEADQRIISEVQNINSLSGQIAELNARISAAEGAQGAIAGDERDRRELLLQQLSEKANVSIVDQSDGTVLVSLSNGFPLVTGATARTLATTTDPSFATGIPPSSLGGGVLSYIVYDYDPSSGSESHIDLTQNITGGTIGGLLELRGYNDVANTSPFNATGTLVEVASRVEAIARSLLVDFNQTYVGPDRDGSSPNHQSSSGDLDGLQPTNGFAFFNAAGLTDVGTLGLAQTSDLTASGLRNFASIIGVAVTDPRRVAAARDTAVAPAAPAFSPGDGQNMTLLAAMQNTSRTFSIGSYSFTGTYEGSYSETVTKVGNEKSSAEVAAKVAEGSYEAALSRRDEVSAVSLDEEFTNLVKFQKAYQAAARMIKVGGELLDEVLRAL